MESIGGLYVITDEQLRPGRTHVQIARAAIEGGARVVQIRDKTAPDRDFYEAALEIRRLTKNAGVMFIVNDRVDVAAAVGADGVNVGQTDLPVAAARAVLGEVSLIGVSVDDVVQARQAVRDGADYVGFGPVFRTGTKLDTGPVRGLEMLREICGVVDVSVVAIGGVGLANIREVGAAGAASAAVISAVVCAVDMTQTVRQLASLLREGQNRGE